MNRKVSSTGILTVLLVLFMCLGLLLYSQSRNLRVRVAVTVGITTGVIDGHLGAAFTRIKQVQEGTQPPKNLRDAAYEILAAQRLLATVESLQPGVTVHMGDSLTYVQNDLSDMSSLQSIDSPQAETLRLISTLIEALRASLPHQNRLGPNTTTVDWDQEANQKATKAATDYLNGRRKR